MAHQHRTLKRSCRKCAAIQERWYAKLREHGFVDIEYGLNNPRFTARLANAADLDAAEKEGYYSRIWAVYHDWAGSGRSERDCRVAELYAQQDGESGTIRGISRVLQAEGLVPWSDKCVQITIRAIRRAAQLPDTSHAPEHEISVESIRSASHYYVTA